MYKVVRFLELMWLVIAIFSVATGTYKLFTMPEIMDALFFYIFACLAVVLFFLRRRQRKNIENSSQQ
ncbi:MAG: hypothetical protein KF732_06330 [Flavobacteriales bacterium]|nr:MAG: hypothetical protein F9K09_03605 [Flavobacteriales bacterium]MBE7441705.1 hypothetical protein [Flavobacteriales bacterium]MBX2959559.1 hypothetical protein [Flavobacteriales bacterium]HRN42929.1 hypothetical protein [Vicingus sp.]